MGLSRGTYSAWGSSTGYTPGTPLAWDGRAGIYTDAETGLVLMGARYCSPSLGQFTRRDPAGFVNGSYLSRADWVSKAVIEMTVLSAANSSASMQRSAKRLSAPRI